MKLKATALVYAIYVCLLISTLTYAFIFLASSQDLLFDKVDQENSLLQKAKNAFLYLKKNPESTLTELPDGCTAQLKPWGAFSVLEIIATHQNDSLQDYYMLANRPLDSTVFYLPKSKHPLQVSGATKVNGLVYIPDAKYKIVNLKSNQYKEIPQLKVTKRIAGLQLPEIKIPKVELTQMDYQYFEPTADISSYFNAFRATTKVIYDQISIRLGAVDYKGNFLIISDQEVRISNTTQLTDVIVVAPIVRIENGFKGSLQIFANALIDIGDSVRLEYPSTITMFEENPLITPQLRMGTETYFNGNIIVITTDNEHKTAIQIDEKSQVNGHIYCKGILDNSTKVNGSIFANKLRKQTAYNSYTNTLYDTHLKNELPSNFVGLEFITDTIVHEKVFLKKVW